ncbi:hypothetical protein INR49_002208, partial [Caranx melampygus]
MCFKKTNAEAPGVPGPSGRAAEIKVALQAGRVREVNGVPGEITLPVRVLDVQPDDVIRDVVVIEPSVHSLHVSFVEVVPAALVVPQGKERGQGLMSLRESVGGGK